MTPGAGDRGFTGRIPELYDTLLVPLIFAPYADDLAARLAARGPRRVLELAAGTGVVTRRLAATLPAGTSIVATDLNPAMLAHASQVGTARPVLWRAADALALPFAEGSVDAVVCQFGAMFFPDRARAFAEARRVLAPGGLFLFSVWDRLADNEFAEEVTRALEPLFPGDPPRFLDRLPHGYHDQGTIARDLAAGGFTATPAFTTLAERSRADDPRLPAVAYCEGTPLRNEIERRDPAALGRATAAATAALAARFGPGPVDGKIQAIVVAVER